MRAQFTKWAASAAMLVVLVTVVLLVSKSVPAAYGLQRAIQAYDHIRCVHVKSSGSGQQAPNEFWIQSNDQGRVEKARYYLPETEDGAKLITWTPQRTELWFQTKRRFLTFQTKRIEPWMQSLLEQSQPQLYLQKLVQDQKAGKVELQIQEPQKDRVVVVVLNRAAHTKQVCAIDRNTDLVSRIEQYRLEDSKEVLQFTTEFCDYNVPLAEKLFSLREDLPKDIRIADQLNQVSGVPQANLTDEQAAVEAVRQFFQALLVKDYKKAGLIVCGELEEYAKAEYGKINLMAIVSVGPAELQTNWVKRGFKVPCELQIINAAGQTALWKPGVYVRPGDNEMHPDYWHITGGVNAHEAEISLLPDNTRYEQMTPKQAATAFFQACAESNWEEVLKFWPRPGADPHFERMKEYLGGLQVVSIGEPYQTNRYPGWYVPYEIRLRPQEFYVRVSNANAAKRYVITGILDSKLRLEQEFKWSQAPEVLANNAAYAGLSPVEAVKAGFDAWLKLDWSEMGKFIPADEVAKTQRQIEEAKKRGIDARQQLPVIETAEAVWSAEHAAYLVKCRTAGNIKKWNLAIRNDNPAKRFLFDGGL